MVDELVSSLIRDPDRINKAIQLLETNKKDDLDQIFARTFGVRREWNLKDPAEFKLAEGVLRRRRRFNGLFGRGFLKSRGVLAAWAAAEECSDDQGVEVLRQFAVPPSEIDVSFVGWMADVFVQEEKFGALTALRRGLNLTILDYLRHDVPSLIWAQRDPVDVAQVVSLYRTHQISMPCLVALAELLACSGWYESAFELIESGFDLFCALASLARPRKDYTIRSPFYITPGYTNEFRVQAVQEATVQARNEFASATRLPQAALAKLVADFVL